MTTILSLTNKETHLAVVGLGYVGLPLAVALNRYFSVYGLDTDSRRIQELRTGIDPTRSATGRDLGAISQQLTTDARVLQRCGLIIITVPTPITANCKPDLAPLEVAARTIGRNIQPGTVVVVESTVYPGVTEQVVGPIIAHESGLNVGQEFHLGYSPERINPGDPSHSVERIVKVVAGDSSQVTDLLHHVYGAVTGGNVHRSASIKTAETAKVIENTQRDLNIAFMNELAMICHRLGVDTREVIRTARTKWNFAAFEPGLVGGHCIGVDPYYLTHAAEQVGYVPHVILAGRNVNDSMGHYVASHTAALIASRGGTPQASSVLILGITFKENISDVRNTRVIDIVHGLAELGVNCSVFDPEADSVTVQTQYGFQLLDDVARDAPYDAVVVAVKHEAFRSSFPLSELASLAVRNRGILVDVKAIYERSAAEAAGFTYWRL